jgi:hypothetical protein
MSIKLPGANIQSGSLIVGTNTVSFVPVSPIAGKTMTLQLSEPLTQYPNLFNFPITSIIQS